MDTTKTYIEMCDKAKEIQKTYKPTIGDFQTNKILFKIIIYSGKYRYNKKKTWLPRQDQLQEMVGRGCPEPLRTVRLIVEFHKFALKCNFMSMEQLWLAFVMKRKYNKEWNGKDWIKKEQ